MRSAKKVEFDRYTHLYALIHRRLPYYAKNWNTKEIISRPDL